MRQQLPLSVGQWQFQMWSFRKKQALQALQACIFDSFAWIIFYVQTEALLTHGPIQAEARTEGGSMIKLWRKYPETESWTRPPAMLSLTDLRWTNWWHSFGPTQTILSLIDLHTSEPVSSGLDLLIIPPEIMTKSKSPILSLLSFAIKINHIYTSEDLTSVGCPEDSCRHWLQLMGTGQWSKLSPVDNIGDSCGQVWPWTSCYLYNCTYD